MTSYRSAQAAYEQVFRDVPETCDAVDAAFIAASNIIKEQTGSLRAAWLSTMEEKFELEGRIYELEYEVKTLEEQLTEDADATT